MVKTISENSVNLALDVSDLSKQYEERMALSHASFAIPLGTICGFVGPNGAGKTTTIRMLLGLISPSTGSGALTSVFIKILSIRSIAARAASCLDFLLLTLFEIIAKTYSSSFAEAKPANATV